MSNPKDSLSVDCVASVRHQLARQQRELDQICRWQIIIYQIALLVFELADQLVPAIIQLLLHTPYPAEIALVIVVVVVVVVQWT